MNKLSKMRLYTTKKQTVSVRFKMHPTENLSNNFSSLIKILETSLPNALPKRYGLSEPPEYEYVKTGINHLLEFLAVAPSPIWHSTYPIIGMFFSNAFLENKKNPIDEYRCNQIELKILKDAYDEVTWKSSIHQLFKELATLYNPFYAEIVDDENHEIDSWWWRGIPEHTGNIVIIGEPYSSLCNIDLYHGEIISPGLYYFENAANLKLSKEYISTRKTSIINDENKVLSKDNYNYANTFPFSAINNPSSEKEVNNKSKIFNMEYFWKNFSEYGFDTQAFFFKRGISFSENIMIDILLHSNDKNLIFNSTIGLRAIGTEKSIEALKNVVFLSNRDIQCASILTIAFLAKGKENEFISQLLLDKRYKQKWYAMVAILYYEDNNHIALKNLLKCGLKEILSSKSISGSTKEQYYPLILYYLAKYAPNNNSSITLFERVNNDIEYLEPKIRDDLIMLFPKIFHNETCRKK